MLTRRNLMISAAPAAAFALAGCGATMPDVNTVTTSVLSYVQQVVAAVAKYVPTAETIATIAASLFGPQWASVVQVGSAALNTLIQVLENVVTQVSPNAQMRIHARLRMSSPRAPVTIGYVNGIAVRGFR